MRAADMAPERSAYPPRSPVGRLCCALLPGSLGNEVRGRLQRHQVVHGRVGCRFVVAAANIRRAGQHPGRVGETDLVVEKRGHQVEDEVELAAVGLLLVRVERPVADEGVDDDDAEERLEEPPVPPRSATSFQVQGSLAQVVVTSIFCAVLKYSLTICGCLTLTW